jgi:hypothetical protein
LAAAKDAAPLIYNVNMILTFEANSVSCATALGGDILQVTFDTVPESMDEEERNTPYVLLSRNFEFPESPTIEWHDGSDYDSGVEIIAVILDRTHIAIRLENGFDIDVAFHLTDKKFAQFKFFMTRMIDNSLVSFC